MPLARFTQSYARKLPLLAAILRRLVFDVVTALPVDRHLRLHILANLMMFAGATDVRDFLRHGERASSLSASC